MSIRKRTRAFAASNDILGTAHFLLTIGLYMGATWLGSVTFGAWWITILCVAIFVGASIRLFAVQHDCGHFAYFSNHRVNIVVGVLMGAFTNNPFFAMRHNHNQHHAYIGNLDRMDCHEVWTLTVDEYLSAPLSTRMAYRIYRSAPVIFFLGPIFIFFLRYRIPKSMLKVGVWDAVLQNLLMASFWLTVFAIFGWSGLYFLITAEVAAACVGTLIVYVGHNHEDTYWARGPQVDFEDASLKGASVLDLGPVFDFMTFNFAYHDLHHLNSKVPCYNLKAAHLALADELQPTRLGLIEAVACIRWKLWDEGQGKMVRFADLRHRSMIPAE